MTAPGAAQSRDATAALPGAAACGEAPLPTGAPVDGYPARPSVRAGEVLRFHVSTRSERFRADFYRCGARPRLMGSTAGPGRYAPPGRHDEDWHWPGHDFAVPGDWPSGVYIAVFGPGTARSAAPPPAGAEALDARHSRMLFVVTAREPARRTRILYKVPVFTYHAYNRSGGASLYGALPHDEAYRTVTLRRPGGGIGGPVKGLPDAHDPRTPRQTFAHWDAPFISWLETSGHTVDYCTDLDLHESPRHAAGYRLLLSAGHDEYWSARTRRHISAFRDRGGNIAVFGANTCWWRVTPTADGTAISCAKYPPGVPQGSDCDRMRGAPDHWWEDEPENSLIGVSYRNGGGHWEGLREPLGFTLQHTDHPVFAGTGLSDGDVLGEEHALVGYECDGAAHRRDLLGRAVATGTDGTPADFTILGVADLPTAPDSGWNTAVRESTDPGRAATFGLYTRGGTVFNAATTDWARLLALDPLVDAITRNVISLLR
ncbi:N,N-dimethylformamidase beta subunit family domain-containing protein [Streptomyces sp. BE308]|uniref:N,N-dimethylformamidase beta subunit family domain-containing protein n=1 Tax=Streptomyces sp. BE308 TaxID=3002529 RepID=UPI002E7A98F4|nr:N,N-dimethylformamidase beta subunit family domain-containing protein [Streptomyces sp. BE308]